jgi:hypothetical protein
MFKHLPGLTQAPAAAADALAYANGVACELQDADAGEEQYLGLAIRALNNCTRTYTPTVRLRGDGESEAQHNVVIWFFGDQNHAWVISRRSGSWLVVSVMSRVAALLPAPVSDAMLLKLAEEQGLGSDPYVYLPARVREQSPTVIACGPFVIPEPDPEPAPAPAAPQGQGQGQEDEQATADAVVPPPASAKRELPPAAATAAATHKTVKKRPKKVTTLQEQPK